MWLMHAGIALCLGFADVVYTYSLTSSDASGSGSKLMNQRWAWKRVFWLEVAFAGLALAILAAGVRVKRAESELTVDEREVMELELEMEMRDVVPRAVRGLEIG